MTKKDIASKLAQGVRRAMQPPFPAPETAAATSERAPTSAAHQADQSPRVSPDDPWDNLHPERIWPD